MEVYDEFLSLVNKCLDYKKSLNVKLQKFG